jgi:predicted GIY-YIG superfamily endonuclease
MHYCYLLRSVRDPQRTYVGYARNVQARLDAHNGKRPGGAKATRSHRPWRVAAIVSGFASEHAALCFEYAWHFPQKPGLVHGRYHFPTHVVYIKSMRIGLCAALPKGLSAALTPSLGTRACSLRRDGTSGCGG